MTHLTTVIYNPTSVDSYIRKGNALYSLGRYDEALVAYDQALLFNPNSGTAYDMKGYAFGQLGRVKEANEAFKKARQLLGF